MTAYTYEGCELDLFAKATRWKAYWRDQIAGFVHGRVLEVGAGIGANAHALARLEFDSWLSLEPDANLASRIETGPKHRVRVGTLAAVDERFDVILYIDVLEHIADDRAEVGLAARRLYPGGSLVVLAPAHPFLFTPFDSAVGHYRRYTRASLRAVIPPELEPRKLVYLDAAGLLASLGNRLLLQSAHPNDAQILAWDRFLVPLSRLLDPLLLGRVGKSVLGVWSKPR
ncbi:MAG: methyltransferase domain-containing protein [Bryobacteraceae bacterium]|nr:methyltransferase domain-containing protein [Bryobacteraceae bacterium]